MVSGAAPAQGSGLPLLAARICFLLLLVPSAAWDAIPDEQVVTKPQGPETSGDSSGIPAAPACAIGS